MTTIATTGIQSQTSIRRTESKTLPVSSASDIQDWKVTTTMKAHHLAMSPLCVFSFVALCTGCSIIHAAKLPPKRNMDVLCSGTPRTNVVAELGTPVSSEVRDGARTDVFTFKQGYSKPVKAGRMVAHGTADILTYGLWELVGTPSELYFDGTDVQLSVNYDGSDNVESVDILKGSEVVNKPKKKALFQKKSAATPAQMATPDAKTVR